MNGTQGCPKYKNMKSLINQTPSIKLFYKGFDA